MEKLKELFEDLFLSKKITPSLWLFKAENLEKEVKLNLIKKKRPGLVFEFHKNEFAEVAFLSTKKIQPRQVFILVGEDCHIGNCKGEVVKTKSYIFIDRSSKRCLFKVPIRFLEDRNESKPCGSCKEELLGLKKRLEDECGQP